MAGHSKWANIKHHKAKQDSLKGKLFTKLIRELTVAARTGGADAASNPRLRAAVQAALSENMTRDTIDRAIARGNGTDEAGNVDEMRYEGYGAGGVAVIVDCMSNNRNRTAGEVRHAFSKCGGNLGSTGSVAYLFKRCGVINFAPGADENRLMEVALELGADDIVTSADGAIEIVTTAEQFETVQAGLMKAGLKPERAEVTFVASTRALLSDLETAQAVVKLIDMLEDLDDVQKVYTNVDIADDIAEQLA